ncbi:glutathione synthase [Aquisalimonas sp.]|uniref:glutathione synthase n=1 Tax=unclassified Aquisalimonas TaxID=2644645 RepID=UPI0025C2B32D|nr:glutathione synthase [Aquisalimonas sp.]
MTIHLGVVMDPIQQIKPWKDTSLAMLLAARRRGWTLHYFELGDLFLRDGEARGRNRSLDVRDDNTDWFTLSDPSEVRLGDLDVILMRKDPPVDAQFTYATHLLERAEAAGARVVNRPAGLRDANEKLFTAHFAQCCAPTLVDCSRDRLRAFIAEQGKAVLKPLDGMGGRSVFVVEQGDPNTSVIIDTLTADGQAYIMAQRYLPEISDGDKRILVIDGEPVDAALARIPAAGETRGNLAAGGRGESVPLTERDRWICQQVGPTLVERGLRFVGLDVIGDYLTEINVTSPTCVRELDAINGTDIGGQFLDRIAADL